MPNDNYDLGRIGVFGSVEALDMPDATRAMQRIESLGYRTFWHGMSLRRDLLLLFSALLNGTQRLILGTGILPIIERPPSVMAAAQRTLIEQFGERFILGLGVSHAPIVEGLYGEKYGRPLATMRDYLDRMDAGGDHYGSADGSADGSENTTNDAEQFAATRAGVDPPRVLAALGPRMLELSRDRAAGALPYMMPPEHTQQAREILGPDRWLCVELTAVLEPEPSRAREVARMVSSQYMDLENYLKTWRRLGFDDADLRDGGSNRFIDAIFAWGNLSAIEQRIQDHLDAGATHVCVQALNPANIESGTHWELIEALAPGA